MNLDETEKLVTLVTSSLVSESIESIKRELDKSGFSVVVRYKGDVREPFLVTQVGTFTGLRSINGFIKGHEKIFSLARQNRQ